MNHIYYQDNDVYQRLKGTSSFVWVSADAWILIYGNQAAVPQLLTFVTSRQYYHSSDFDKSKNKKIIQVCRDISQRAGIAFIQIAFDSSVHQIEGVKVRQEKDWCEMSLQQLSQLFSLYQIPVKPTICHKAINDKASSAYHKWQRDNLGADIIVSDIDLMRCDASGQVVELIELKRSYYPLYRWSPFADDFANFNLCLTLCQWANISHFYIVYNVRQKHPFRDDASQVAIFSYEKVNFYRKIGTFNFQDFIAANYHH